MRKLLYTVILLFSFVISFFCDTKIVFAQNSENPFIVVIDPGHGGKDTGAIGHRTREKDVNLGVALRVRSILQQQYPEVKVIMTREDDTFIGLQQRANIANRNKANIFISIHSNSASSSTANGAETYVLGLWRTEDNLRVAMKENKSILLEKDYKVTYQGFDPSSTESYIIFEMLQNRHLNQSIDLAQHVQNQLRRLPLANRGVRQAGFLVIREIAMPGILVELGFVSNKNDAMFLSSSSGKTKLAQAIVNGFGKYYEDFVRRSKGNKFANDIATRRKMGEQKLEEPQKNGDSSELDDSDTNFNSESELDNNATKEATIPKRKIIKENKSTASNALSYRIQISASKKKMSTRDPWFRGLNVTRTQQGNIYIYTVEHTTSLSKARKLLKEHKRRFKDAYIVVYRGNKKVDTIYR